jgi:uncharacterized damage-inducible protein DinB
MRFASCCRSLLGCCVLAAASTYVLAQAPAGPPPGTHVSPSATYDKLLSGFEKNFVAAAEAMPAEKFDFKPATSQGEFGDVRTFGAEVKHVAEANYYFFHDPDVPLKASDRDAIEKLTSKDDIVKALTDSFAQAHKYIASITDENAFVMTKNGTRAGQAAFGIAHFMDHYGQMCVYLRMNGIVPPASRK